ncbi:extracellular matrix protein 2 [Salminus brasiliensis]|uniref:extracellular matrix protein 2 n=1 Tax=Salminus brasiliensis TaxID=930266 RepID=UPI003B833822
MPRPLAYLCVFLCVCVAISVTEGRGVRGRSEKQKKSFVPAAAGYDTPAHPVSSTQCLVNGIFLFEGAAWSPDACNVCQCRAGTVSCHPVPCLVTAPPVSRSVVREQKAPSEVKLVKSSRGKSVHQQNGKGKIIPEVKPKMTTTPVKTVEAPPALPKKTPPLKEEVAKPQWWNRKPPAVQSPEPVPGLGVVERMSFDHDDHDDDDDYVEDDSDGDDDDDDNDGAFLNSAARVAPNDKPAAIPAQKPALPPAQRSFAPPTRQSVILPPGKPLPVPSGRPIGPGRPVITPYVHMESLPAGCLLSESLIACGNTGLTHLPLLKDTGIRTLYLADNKISKIPTRALAGLPNVEWLDLSKNKLDDFSLGLDVFRNLTKLRRLNLDGNNLTKVPPLPPSLLELKINDNRLSGLTPHSFKGLSQLLTLELEDNHFHDGNVSPLAFRNLGKLIYLRLDDNDFRAIPSGLPTSLQELHLSDNRIEVVHAGLLNKTVNLRVLNLSHNKIREDRIAPRAWIHLRKLESLDLSYNKLVHVPSFLPVGLRQLTLHHNQIERIPGYVFGHLKPGLDSLHLSYNRLHEDGVSEVSFLGLYQSLSELLLDHNQLRAIPRGVIQLRALQLLRLNHNYISSVPMNSLCDSTAREDSPLLSVHLQYNLIDRRLIPHTALSCIRTYQSVILRPQRHEQIYE